MGEEQPGYSERDDEPTTEQTGGDPAELRRMERERAAAEEESDEATGAPEPPPD
jgi:hypothetical protein